MVWTAKNLHEMHFPQTGFKPHTDGIPDPSDSISLSSNGVVTRIGFQITLCAILQKDTNNSFSFQSDGSDRGFLSSPALADHNLSGPCTVLH